jgi:hypothetical protein
MSVEKNYSSFGNNTHMSRLGKQPIQIPAGVTVTCADGVLKVSGPKGELSRVVAGDVAIAIADHVVTVSKTKENPKSQALWGTYAAHIHNMIAGVTEGFTKILEIEGVGYRAEAQNDKIKLSVGFSHLWSLLHQRMCTSRLKKMSSPLRVLIRRWSDSMQQTSERLRNQNHTRGREFDTEASTLLESRVRRVCRNRTLRNVL